MTRQGGIEAIGVASGLPQRSNVGTDVLDVGVAHADHVDRAPSHGGTVDA